MLVIHIDKKKDNEKAEIFKKIEPYLTFLDTQKLERQGADLQTKIEELQYINHLLRNKQNERRTDEGNARPDSNNYEYFS